MPLTSFGAILTFAESMELQDSVFYKALTGRSIAGNAASLFEQLAAEGEKNIKLIQRARRENVTEMILEPIQDFTRKPFEIDPGDPSTMDRGQAFAAALAIETRAKDFYHTAAEKIRALPEVSRELKRLGKKRGERLARLS